METILANLEIGIQAALVNSMAEDRHAIDTYGYMVGWWLAGDTHDAAKAYVLSYFAQFGDTVRIIETERSDEPGAVDVFFNCNGSTDCFTVWLDDTAPAFRVYGEY